jgi:cbb3-type cytochrome oxidase maturation protein
MIVLYLILPLALVIAGGAVAAFIWTVRSGQLDDVDTPPHRILIEDALGAGTRKACVVPDGPRVDCAFSVPRSPIAGHDS